MIYIIFKYSFSCCILKLLFLLILLILVNYNLWVFKDVYSKQILYYKVVKYETDEAYKDWIEYLIKQWVVIKAIETTILIH